MNGDLYDAITKADQLRKDHNGIGGVYLYLGHDGDNVCELKDSSSKQIGKGCSGRNMSEAVDRAVWDWKDRKAKKNPPDKRLRVLNIADDVDYCASEAVCLNRILDEHEIPRVDPNGAVLSLWGRVCRYRDEILKVSDQ